MLTAGTRGRVRSAAFGKRHLNHDPLSPNVAGYEHFSGTLEGNMPNYFAWENITNGASESISGYAPSFKIDSALLWMRETRAPFFCYLAFNLPHAAFHAPPAQLHTIDLSSGTDRDHYRAMVQALDTEIGRLFAGSGAEAPRPASEAGMGSRIPVSLRRSGGAVVATNRGVGRGRLVWCCWQCAATRDPAFVVGCGGLAGGRLAGCW